MTTADREAALCPWTGDAMRSWMVVPGDWRRPEVAESYEAVRCDQCGYGLLYPRPTPQQIRESYDIAEYYTHRRGGKRPATVPWLHRLRQHIAWRCDHGKTLDADQVQLHVQHTPSRVIEIGCGNGGLLMGVRDFGHEVVGVEPDPSAQAVARAASIQVYEGSAETLPEALLREHGMHSFDIVLMRHVLEHCLDPRLALQSARTLLKPGGRLLCETPNNDALGLRFAGPSWNWLDVPRHINFFTSDSLVAACESAGFDVLDSRYCGYYRQFDRAWIDTEQHIQETLPKAGIRTPAHARAWALLVSTAFASRRLKYDSVRVLAVPRPVS
jgi:SAM-dependent methyltransferase